MKNDILQEPSKLFNFEMLGLKAEQKLSNIEIFCYAIVSKTILLIGNVDKHMNIKKA